MKYPVVIHKDPDSDFGVAFPDLAGCFSAGSTLDEAFASAVEAAECHLEGMLLDGDEVPVPRRIEDHVHDPQFSGGIWGVVEVDLSKLSGKTRRINISVPEGLLHQIDRYVSEAGESRSGFLVHAALEYVASHPAKS